MNLLYVHCNHTDRHHLTAEVKNVKADKAVFDVHVGLLGEGVVRTGREQLDLHRELLRLRFRLFFEVFHKVDQHRDLPLVFLLDERRVNIRQAAVDDGFFKRADVILAGDLLKERHDEFRLHRNRIAALAVVLVDVECVDVVFTRRRKLNDLSAQSVNKRLVLTFRVDDDDVRVARQKKINDLFLCCERLT